MKKNNLLPSKRMIPETLPEGIQIINAPIEEVCISEDRAEIRRTANVSLKNGKGTVFPTKSDDQYARILSGKN